MQHRPLDAEELLTPQEVSQLFRVDPKTVTRWARAGKLSSIRTLGGHRRYRRVEVMGLLRPDDSDIREWADTQVAAKASRYECIPEDK